MLLQGLNGQLCHFPNRVLYARIVVFSALRVNKLAFPVSGHRVLGENIILMVLRDFSFYIERARRSEIALSNPYNFPANGWYSNASFAALLPPRSNLNMTSTKKFRCTTLALWPPIVKVQYGNSKTAKVKIFVRFSRGSESIKSV